jgi:hypothetical protein
MKRLIAVLMAVVGLAGATTAYAQESRVAQGPVVVTFIPGGATFFTQGKDTKAPSFGNYGLGGALEVKLNRFVAVEGEVTGALGITQDLEFSNGTSNVKTPNLVTYSGNVVVLASTRSSVVPYVTGGVGGLTVLEKASLGIPDTQTFLTGNVGGGVKWFSGRWGLRADYRFTAVRSKDDAPSSSFFGQETRYGHRVYGGVLINVGR